MLEPWSPISKGECTTHGRLESSSRGSEPMLTASTTLPGCAGRRASFVRSARTRVDGPWSGELQVRELQEGDGRDGRHTVRSAQDAAHGVVRGVLAVRDGEGRGL